MLNGTTPSSPVPSNVVNGTLVRVIGCFGTIKRPAERAWRSGIRVGGEGLLLLLARRKQGTTTSDRRGASQSAATLCSAILSTHDPPRAAEAVTCLRSQDGSRAVDAACCHPIHAICAVLLADLVPACYSLQAAAA